MGRIITKEMQNPTGIDMSEEDIKREMSAIASMVNDVILKQFALVAFTSMLHMNPNLETRGDKLDFLNTVKQLAYNQLHNVVGVGKHPDEETEKEYMGLVGNLFNKQFDQYALKLLDVSAVDTSNGAKPETSDVYKKFISYLVGSGK